MRRTFGKTGLMGKAALENENLTGTGEGEPELGEAEQSLETDLIEIAEDGAEGDKDEAEVDEAVDVVEALEALADDLAIIAKEGGGLNSHAAAAIGRQVNFQYKRIGLEHQSMPALESFGSTSGRIGATTIGMEDIREQAKKIWAQIVEAIKKSIQWVKDYFTKMFGAANKLEKRAKALAERANSTTGSAKEKTIENERLAKALAIGGAVPNGMPAKAAAVKKLADGVFTASNVKMGEAIADALEGGTPASGVSFAIQGVNDVTNGEADGFNAPGEGLKNVRSEELPGGLAIVGAVPTGSDVEAVSRQFMRVGKFKPNAKGEVKKDLPVLTAADGAKIAEIVADLAIVIQGYKASLDKIAKIKDRILKGAEKVGRDAAAEQDEEKKGNAKVTQRLAASTARLLDQPATDFSRYSLSTGTALLNYVELSLKQYA